MLIGFKFSPGVQNIPSGRRQIGYALRATRGPMGVNDNDWRRYIVVDYDWSSLFLI